MFIYGRSRQLYRHLAATRPLSLDERLTIFRETAQRNHYSVADRAQLISALGLGMAVWTLGSWTGAATALRPAMRG